MNILMTLFWLLGASVFAGWLYFACGHEMAYQFISGYLLEKSLSVDNLLVFTMVFAYFRIRGNLQSRYLNLGIILAFLLRGIFIFSGAAIISHFHWVLYIFGAFLLYGAFKIFKQDEEPDISKNPLVKWIERYVPRAFVVILSIEFLDIVFAFDSIPATFAVTQNPFIVYSSNLFAILGLRSLYFVIAGMLDRFESLKYGISIVLAFIGLKILISGVFIIPTVVSLIVTAVILGSSCSIFLTPQLKTPVRIQSHPNSMTSWVFVSLNLSSRAIIDIIVAKTQQ